MVRSSTALAMMTLAMPATAQNMSFGADNFYRSNNVSSQPITFQNQFKMVVTADLFVPKDLGAGVRAPAIVVGHPMGAVIGWEREDTAMGLEEKRRGGS
ncbi:hypothetical protein ON010_g10299 [Phytophthora cinnamomi]|nr:hypothetical protein ON010_g10299 [Phytophthora cinnamomi]